MTAELTGIVGLVLLVVLLLLGIHIGLVLLLVGFLGMWVLFGFNGAITYLGHVPFSTTHEYAYTIVPLFILMGEYAMESGLPSYIYEAAHKILGRMRGSLAVATVAACAAFGAVSGSTVATAAIFTKLSLGEMLKRGYSKTLASGCIAAAGGLAALIPPSTLLVLYAVFAEVSVGKSLMAGLIPGVLLAIVLTAIVVIWTKLRPATAPLSLVRTPWREQRQSLRRLWPLLILVIVIWGGIYSGVFSANEAAGVSSVITFVYLVGAKGRSAWKPIVTATLSSLRTTALVFLILMGAVLFSRFIAASQLPVRFGEFVETLQAGPYAILTLFLFMYLVLGMFLDPVGQMAITFPIVIPALKTLGFDLIWFAAVIVVMLELGMMTPPFGLNVFTVKGAAGDMVSLGDIFKGIVPFILGYFVVVALLVAFPVLALFLPSMM